QLAWSEPADAARGPRARVETLERGTLEGRIQSIRDGRLELDAPDQPTVVGLEELTSIDILAEDEAAASRPAAGAPKAASGPMDSAPSVSGPAPRSLMCYLADGGALSGILRGGGGPQIRMSVIGLATPVAFPFEALAGVRFASISDPAAEREFQ